MTPSLLRNRGRSLACAALLWSLCAGLGAAQADVVTEAGVKAAYLYKFLAFVEWPGSSLPAPDSPLVVGVVGADAVNDELEAVVAGRRVNGRPVVTRRLAEGDPVEGLHAVFIGKVRQPGRLLEQLRGMPVLVVTEGTPGLGSGSMLNFVPMDGRIRFEASQVAAERAGLKLGARLLAVAERVVTR